MKLDQKYFVPFIAIGAIITMIFIVFASFNFKDEQESDFRENTRSFEQLRSMNHPIVGGAETDSLRLGDLVGKKVIVLFWATWSEKSTEIMNELDIFDGNENYAVIGALVKDVTDEATTALPNHNFIYIDGTRLFNELKVPGIPSYFLLDEKGNFLDSFVGYKQSAVNQIQIEFDAL